MKKSQRLDKDNPPKSKDVYKNGILYYTISYWWLDPESKEVKNGIFNAGWNEWHNHNYSHPLMIKEIEEIKEKQEEVRKSAEVDWSKMEDIVFDI